MRQTAESEIGSDFALDAGGPGPGTEEDDTSFVAEPPQRAVLRALGWHDPTLTRSGRDALSLVAAELGRRGVRTILLPSFLCGSVLQGSRPLNSVLLPVGPDLLPEPDAVRAAARVHGGQAALLLLPLFGWGLSPALLAAAGDAEQAGVTLIEDRTHSLLSPGVPTRAPFGVASLRKWGPFPDGGVACGVTAPAAARDETGFASARAHALRRKAQFPADGTGSKEESYLGPLRRAEEALDAAPLPRGMGSLSRALLARFAHDAIAARRQANHDALREAISGLPLTPLHPPRAAGITPLGLPVLFRDRAARDAARRALIDRRIYCALHWPSPPGVDPALFPAAADAAARILTLPCDQRYSTLDMQRLARSLRQVLL